MQKFGIKLAAKILPHRQKKSNKTSGGRALIIAGSPGMSGAGVLCARAAARIGAGYTILMTESKAGQKIDQTPDFLTAELGTKKKISFTSIGVGPGLGDSLKTQKTLNEILKTRPEKVVLDADALNFLAKKFGKKPSLPKPLPATWIFTPHEGELARLLGVNAVSVKKSRLKYLLLCQKKYGCVVVLKGHGTLIASQAVGKRTQVFQVMTGNEALAKAGTGDVLTGMIAGLLAQGVEPLSAACAAATIHGYLADLWVKSGKDHLSLMPSDLIELLPEALSKVRSMK